MSQRQHRRDNLADLISDMENDVRDLTRWGTVVYDLGSSDNCDRAGVQVVGRVIEDLAKRVEDSWEVAFAMSRRSQEAAR